MRASATTSDAKVQLEDAPPWVREAYEKAAAGRGPVVDSLEAESILIRDRILVTLRRQGLSQVDLARRLGKAPSAISRVLKSPARSRIKTLHEIAAALGIDPGSLFSK
jgi:ribosome-binding protein aMBF1 (putative translation factor)